MIIIEILRNRFPHFKLVDIFFDLFYLKYYQNSSVTPLAIFLAKTHEKVSAYENNATIENFGIV